WAFIRIIENAQMSNCLSMIKDHKRLWRHPIGIGSIRTMLSWTDSQRFALIAQKSDEPTTERNLWLVLRSHRLRQLLPQIGQDVSLNAQDLTTAGHLDAACGNVVADRCRLGSRIGTEN